MTEATTLKVLRRIGAILKGHYRGTSGRHFDEYFKSEILFTTPELVASLCLPLARHFAKYPVQGVISPALGGIVLSQWTTFQLNVLNVNKGKVKALYAEKSGEDFIFEPEYVQFINGFNLLAIDDTITTAGSLKKVIAAATRLGGNVIGAGTLLNRGGIKSVDLGVAEFFSLVNIDLPSWIPEECPLCKEGVPVMKG
jgi:orotate phosphoribosyltransferase